MNEGQKTSIKTIFDIKFCSIRENKKHAQHCLYEKLTKKCQNPQKAPFVLGKRFKSLDIARWAI